eukprot:m.226406 g.226406  ORF g.226406 m.226406 type:complete len:249 (-) comp15656_c0_seq16:1929-2675(-)
MVLFTQIARLNDGLPLCATTEDFSGAKEFKKLAKDLCRKLTSSSPTRLSITAGSRLFHYAVENDVIYLALCDKGFPKGNVFAYLEDIQQEFGQLHGDSVATQARPYALISFESYIEKTTRRYTDSGGDRSNLEKNVGADMIDVQVRNECFENPGASPPFTENVHVVGIRRESASRPLKKCSKRELSLTIPITRCYSGKPRLARAQGRCQPCRWSTTSCQMFIALWERTLSRCWTEARTLTLLVPGQQC